MKIILAKKESMTQYFTEKGEVVPATILNAGPVHVIKIKTTDTDGYNAVQVGYGLRKEGRLSKAFLGSVGGKNFASVSEFRLKPENIGAFEKDQTIDVSSFTEGDVITVSGISKGKGFQGVVKRHGFKGGRRSHGQKHSEREPGSIGGGLRNRVPKGMRMAGRMGGDVITVKNLVVLSVDKENNTMLVKGAVPGRRGSLVSVIQ